MMIYLDNNATTATHPTVVHAMLPFFSEHFGNAASPHRMGEFAHKTIDDARGRVASLLGCEPAEIVFAASATEALNLAIFGAAEARPDRRHIVVSAVEHPAVMQPIAKLVQHGYSVTKIGVDSAGRLDLAALTDAVRSDTLFVAVMAANNETGVRFPVEDATIAAICRAHGALFVCDASQAVGRVPVNVREWGADCVALSAHKFHGPKGVGALIVRRHAPIAPQILGGGHQRGWRSGTENVPGIVGLGTAAWLASALLRTTVWNDIERLRDRMESALLNSVPGVMVLGKEALRLPNTLCIALPQVAAGAIVQRLDDARVYVSASSACRSADPEPSHVLRAMHVPETHIHGVLRISLNREMTAPEIIATATERILAAITACTA